MSDVDELKATDERLTSAFNRRDISFLDDFHEQHVLFTMNAPFPLTGKDAVTAAYRAFFDSVESVTLTLIEPQYRIHGATGVVWGFSSVAIKPKDGPARLEFNRYTDAYIKSDGRWLCVLSHMSRIPSGT